MQIVYSPLHHLHAAPEEFTQGMLIPSHECPQRVDLLLEELRNHPWAQIIEPRSFGREKILNVHTPGLLALLEHGYTEWEKLGRTGPAFPSSWPLQSGKELPVPSHIDGKLGYYCADTATALTQTSWPAIKASVDCALTAADLILEGEGSAFAICRPPGHHAAQNYYGGFCFLNNSAIAAEHLLANKKGKVAILDIDYHHGNGTQEIFYRRQDVLTVSVHADPHFEYPFYWGYAHEMGEQDGLGYNLNLPLPAGTEDLEWLKALERALHVIQDYQPDVMIVGLGVDTFKEDPISAFKISTSAYPQAGALMASLQIPTLFVLEGGYAISSLGSNVTGVLQGYLEKVHVHGN